MQTQGADCVSRCRDIILGNGDSAPHGAHVHSNRPRRSGPAGVQERPKTKFRVNCPPTRFDRMVHADPTGEMLVG